MHQSFKALQLKARHQVYTLLSGNNLSKLHGEGYDFSQLREYQSGDDIRKINWTISAKLGKPYIKELDANRELSIVVATLMDGSLYFGEGNAKQKKLTEAATLLGYAAQHNGDLFTGISYTQNHTEYTPPTKQPYFIEQFSKLLYDTPLLNTTLDYTGAIDDLFKKVHQPSLIFIIGDFLNAVDLSLLAQKHEVIVLIIRDIEEESLKKIGEITLKSPQNGSAIETYFGKRSVQKYLAKLCEHDERLVEHFSSYDIRYTKITTEDEVVSKLLSLFL